MSYQVFQPATAAEAIELLSASPVPLDCPTQRRSRSRHYLEYAFEAGQRRPEWVWAVRAGGVRPAAVLAGLGTGAGIVLDHFGAHDPNALPAVLRAATRYARRLPGPEACLFVPASLESTSAPVRPWAAALHDAGWRLLVDAAITSSRPTPSSAPASPAPCAWSR